jgi:MYXO-CTERM domain-containing protein
MDAVVQVIPVAKSGSNAPGSVDAGEAGLVDPDRHVGRVDVLPPIAAGLAALVMLALLASRRRRARP